MDLTMMAGCVKRQPQSAFMCPDRCQIGHVDGWSQLRGRFRRCVVETSMGIASPDRSDDIFLPWSLPTVAGSNIM